MVELWNRWWNSRTSDGGTVERMWCNRRTYDGGTEEKSWWNSGTEIVEQWNREG